LLVARGLADGARLGLLNRELVRRTRDGRAERRILRSPGEMLDVLAAQFDLHFPAGTTFPCGAIDWSDVSHEELA
jgi:N-hydroxyarylamine O-acetyltransferase